MALKRLLGFGIALASIGGLPKNARAAEPVTHASKITFDAAGALVIDGTKVFPLTLTIVPGPDAKAPNGKSAFEQFVDDGIVFIRSGEKSQEWSEDQVQRELALQATAASHGLRCNPMLFEHLGELRSGDKAGEAKLIQLIEKFKVSPGMGMWKAADEPEWENEGSKKFAAKKGTQEKGTPEQIINTARVIREHDANHPIWLVQAPRGTLASLKRYAPGLDVGGVDIYPISYPPGVHTEEKNKELSMVGDYTRIAREAAAGKPFWMTLQIAFSGVVNPGRTLRFPTFPEQRFMAYEAIIGGSRGLTYFGGGLKQTLNKRDEPLGFNWTYWDKVMRPLLEEIGPKSPIQPVLVAPDSKIKLSVATDTPEKRKKANKAQEIKGAQQEATEFVQDQAKGDARQIEFLVREVGNDVYVLACKKEGPTAFVRFSGLPANCKTGEVVFEEPRTVTAEDGGFSDWFGPFEVHVYKFTRG